MIWLNEWANGSALRYNVGTAQGELALLGANGKFDAALLPDPDNPDLSGYATTTALNNGLATRATITALNNGLALKANLSSPVFTNDPRGPTPPAGDNDKSLATTDWVQRELPRSIAARVGVNVIVPEVLTSPNASMVITGLAIDADADVLVLDNNADAVWAFRGNARYSAKDISSATLGFSVPYGIAVDADGDVLVVDASTDSVRAFRNGARHAAKDISSAVIRSTSRGGAINPRGIAVDADGDILILDSNNAG